MNNHPSCELAEPAGRLADAARYALTRRLIPVLRHHMVVHLQPIGMFYKVLDRKLIADQPDLLPIRNGLAKINHLARSAIGSCLDVVGWLAPDAGAGIALAAGVDECLAMLDSNFRFRGFTICNGLGAAALPVSQSALREVFTAAMLAASDSAAGPVELVLQAQVTVARAVLTIESRPGAGSGCDAEMAYRAITWADVEALAQAHGVVLMHAGSVATLTFMASPELAQPHGCARGEGGRHPGGTAPAPAPAGRSVSPGSWPGRAGP